MRRRRTRWTCSSQQRLCPSAKQLGECRVRISLQHLTWSPFTHTFAAKNQYLVDALNRPQTVCDNDAGSPFEKPVNRVLEPPLRRGIQSGRRLVQNDQAGVTHEDACERQKLCFAR